MLILDTNVVSELRKAASGRANSGVTDWANDVPATLMFLSVISLHELEHGVLLGVSSVKDLPDVKDFMADKIDNADLPLTQRTLAKDHLAGLPDGDATLHGDFHPGNVLATTDGPRVIDWGEASQGDPAADIARTLVLLTPESAAGALPHAGQATALIAAFAHTYLQRCVETTQVTVEAIAAWRLPVIAARLSEHIAETCAHNRLAAELGTVNRFVVLLGRPLATATPLASRFHI